jgi:hypothetical protein
MTRVGPAAYAITSDVSAPAVFLAAPLADPARAASRAPKQPDAREPEANARG